MSSNPPTRHWLRTSGIRRPDDVTRIVHQLETLGAIRADCSVTNYAQGWAVFELNLPPSLSTDAFDERLAHHNLPRLFQRAQD